MTATTTQKREVKYGVKRKGATTNPYGANGSLHDPRQRYCWNLYINPHSATFSNAYKSALKAGYTEQTSLNITGERWFTEKLGRLSLLSKAEESLKEVLEMDITDPVTGKIDTAVLSNKLRVSMFIAERLGKNEGYSTKQELVNTNRINLTENNPALDALFGDEED